MTVIEVETDGLEVLREQLRNAAAFLDSPIARIADPLGDYFAHRLRRQFNSGGGEFGTQWAPVGDKWAKVKLRVMGGGQPTGVFTGRLRSSFIDRTSPDHFERVEADGSFVFGVQGARQVRRLRTGDPTGTATRRGRGGMKYVHQPGEVATRFHEDRPIINEDARMRADFQGLLGDGWRLAVDGEGGE